MSHAGAALAAHAAAASSTTDTARSSTDVRVFGCLAGLTYGSDRAEIERRNATGLSAITSRSLLDELMNLPVGCSVAMNDLSPQQRRVFKSAPDGVLSVSGQHIVRHAIPPINVTMAVVSAQSWREGLRRAGRFTPFCARAVLLSRVPDDLEESCLQASFYGIGLLVLEAQELSRLVEPEPYTQLRHSAGQWWFSEEIHRQTIESALARNSPAAF